MQQRISRAAVIRDAEALLNTEHQAAAAPRVLWAGLDESPEAFALQCARLQNQGEFRILAAVPYGWSVPAGVQRVAFPPKHFRLLHRSLKRRYRVASGGRGSAKSHSFATATILRCLGGFERVLCARELQTSLLESVHHLLEAKIDALNLRPYFDITKTEITCSVTKSEIIFKGVSNNVAAIKSLEGITICWLEEAEVISARSFEVLVPTIRAESSEIWISLNPDSKDAPAMAYCTTEREGLEYIHVTYVDNPFFTTVLEEERANMERVDADAYQHVWMGKTRQNSDAQVFKGKYVIESFVPDRDALEEGCIKDKAVLDTLYRLGRLKPENEPRPLWQGPFLGLDFGFSEDPTAAVLCWISGRNLYIEYEAYKRKCDIDRTPALLDEIPEARKYVMRADNSRPESISYLKQHGYPKVVACTKGKGSVLDGIAFIRGFDRVVIHPRCIYVAEEFHLYSYKVNKLTDDVLPDLVDKHNHTIDSLRYALEPAIRHRRAARIYPLPF